MVRDLSEFGFPYVNVNVKKLSLVSLRPSPDEKLDDKSDEIHVSFVCDGSLIVLTYNPSKREKAVALYDFLKKCLYEVGD